MPKLSQPRNALEYVNAAPGETEYVLSDGRGLGLLVKPSGAKYWVFRYRIDGKNHKIMLQGSFPSTSLVQAREEAALLRRYVNAGINPNDVVREQRQLAPRKPPPPRPRPRTPPNRHFPVRDTIKCDIGFEDAAEDWLQANYSGRPEEMAKIRKRLNHYLKPKFDLVAISKITIHDLFALEYDIKQKKSAATAKGIRNLGLQILKWAIFRHESAS